MATENPNAEASNMSDILDEEQSNCTMCSNKDTIEMVACDSCGKWLHFSCARVDKSIVGKDWFCTECIAQPNIQRSDKADSADHHKPNSQRQRQIRIADLQQKMDELKLSIEAITTQHAAKPAQQNLLSPENQIQHFLARQTISKELPQFFGSPEQWPTFIAAYEYSTSACQYSVVENLCRLQKALKGDARKMVESLLTHPSNVSSIIETMKMLYGRPALIIQSQIDALKRSPAPKADKLESLVFYAVQVRNLVAATDSANLQAYHCDARLVQELVERLPAQIRLDWGIFDLQPTSEPKLKRFSNWLNTIAQGACNVMTRIPSTTKSNDSTRVNVHASQSGESALTESAPHNNFEKCQICLESCSSATECKHFAKMSVNERWSAVNRLKLCRMCLRHHKSPRCQKAKECGINECKRLHHKLLHRVDEAVNANKESQSTTVVAIQRNRSDILFRIVPITLRNDRVRVDTFAFIDDGSSITLLEKEIADLLRFKGTKRQLCMRWTDGQCHTEDDSRTGKLKICALGEQTVFRDITVQTISQLDLPIQSINRDALHEKYEYLRDVPLESYYDARPTLLLGLDNWHLCVPINVKEGGIHQPVATKTRLGWDLCGFESSSAPSTEHRVNAHLCDCTDNRLSEIVEQFHALDSIGICNNKGYDLNDDEKRADKIMKDCTTQKGKHFEVSLLWKYDSFELPDSYSMAYKRLICLERKLTSKPLLLEAFAKQMKHYIDKGFLRKLSPSELQTSYPKVWYLPVFIIENPNKPGKIRLVFDAAAKVDGISLNTMLLRGRDLVSPLIEILMRFRIPKYALAGDIREMFHMVHVAEKDQMVQRILWRDCQQSKEPDVFVMTVMTFGATCSPYQAQYVMRLNASKHSSQYPETVKSIIKNTYVDDVLDGRDSEDELVQLAKQMQFIHSQGGFEIRNFKTNSPKLKKELNKAEGAVYSLNENHIVEKVLGIFWSVDDDCITFLLRFNKANRDVLTGKRRPTKRDILVMLMSIYDPLGLIAFAIAGLKFIQRESWRLKLDWDDPIPDELSKQWMTWLNQFKSIESLKIPRRYITDAWTESTEISIHTFADAGEAGYAAAIYLRVVTATGVQTSLVTAKVKAAPLKYTPIPRLELQAATIGSRLFKKTVEALDIPIHHSYFWSDSTVVLSWLRSNKKLPIWVANRAGEIREITNIEHWRWVPSAENVADIPTKWRDVLNFDANSRWFKGPEFLSLDERFWPQQTDKGEDEVNKFEYEDSTFQYIALHNEAQHIIDFSRFSKWNKLLRASAYVIRFINCIKRSAIKNTGVLTSTELREAENLLFREAQKIYSADVALLKKGEKIPKHSALYKLSPTLDENHIILLKGRINNDYPIILPKSHYITRLIVSKMHEDCAHQFSETVVNELRKRFHIPRLRILVNQVRRECRMCKIRLAQAAPPEMSPLPNGRLAIDNAPFSHTGIDLFGPLAVTVHRKPEKRWVVLFTCLTVRAIHLEMVKDISTDSFLLAFRNFVARRGQPLECYSDRGTNLIGAEKVLKEAYKEVNFDKVEEATTSANLKWHFNPPLSPHMGGAWERLIRSVKSAMQVIIDPLHKPTPEVLQSVLIEVESLINSRPLTYVPLEHPEQEAITPSHALLAYRNPTKPLGVPPEDVKVPRLQWRQSQQALQRFYHKWILCYRPTLIRRAKWFETSSQLRIGDIVIIIDENEKTRSFPKGRVVNVTYSKDGLVRAATVQTQHGIYLRPAVMLAKLDVDVGSDEGSSRAAV